MVTGIPLPPPPKPPKLVLLNMYVQKNMKIINANASNTIVHVRPNKESHAAGAVVVAVVAEIKSVVGTPVDVMACVVVVAGVVGVKMVVAAGVVDVKLVVATGVVDVKMFVVAGVVCVKIVVAAGVVDAKVVVGVNGVNAVGTGL